MVSQTFSEEEFTRTHPAFVWAYRASHNWATIKSLIPGMKSHLQVTDSAALYHPKYYPSIFSTNRAYLDFSVIFKELFSIAALDLSNLIQQPLEALGTLYEEPIETGRHPRRPRSRSHSTISTSEMEAGGVELEKPVLPNFLSAGKFLFVIRHVDKNSVAELAAAGFRFAPLAQISNTLARSMELPAEELASRFRHMQAQNTSESMISPGVHLACFMLRPRLRQGFDILVPAKTQNQLPTVRLPYSELAPKQLEILDKMDNCTVGQIFERFEGNKGQDQNSEADFWRHFQRAMTSLVKRIGDRSIMQARFSARAIEAPCRPQSNTINAPKQCYLFSIHMISTIHTIAPNSDFSFIPLRSFSVQQQVYMGEADQEAFSRQAYLEFAHCFDSKDDECESSSKHSSHVAIIPIRPKDSQTSFQWPRSSLRRSDSGERRDSIVPASEKMPTVHSGPIVVSSQVTVETSGGIVRSSTAESEEQRMGTTGGASAVAIETETYVDYLFALCKR